MQPNHYQALVSLLSNVLEAYTTAFFILDSKTRCLNLAASQSLSKFISENISLPLEHSGILAQAQKAGHTIHMDKLQDVSAGISTTVPFYGDGESHIKGLCVVPVGGGAGILYVDTKYSWGFNDKQQKWIREVADVLNNLVQQQSRMKLQQDYARVFEFNQRLDKACPDENALEEYCRTFVSECAHFLNVEYGFMAVKEPASDLYRIITATSNAPRNIASQTLSIKSGLVGRIFQNEKNLFVQRLNTQTPDHFLFTHSEGLPHQGTFWGLYSRMSLGYSVVLSFLSRQSVEWSSEEQYGVSHALDFSRLLIEHCTVKDEFQHLQICDFCTGLYNSPAFEIKLEQILTSSMQSSTPFTLAVVQYEPWEILSTKAHPKQVRQWQADIASAVVEALPDDSIAGQLAENRYGIIFPAMAQREAQDHLSPAMEAGRKSFARKMKGFRLQPYAGSVTFPYEGTRTEELWLLVYDRLLSFFRSTIDNPDVS